MPDEMTGTIAMTVLIHTVVTIHRTAVTMILSVSGVNRHAVLSEVNFKVRVWTVEEDPGLLMLSGLTRHVHVLAVEAGSTRTLMIVPP